MHPSDPSLKRSRYFTPWVVIGLTLAVFAAALACVGGYLRQELQRQIAGRDAEVLQAVAVMQQLVGDAETGQESGTNAADQLEMILKTSELRGLVESLHGVIAARLFAADGRFVIASDPDISEATLSAEDFKSLRNLRPVSHYRARAVRSDLFLTASESERIPFPLLEVDIPLTGKNHRALAGIAQFILNGESMQAEFAALDRNLVKQALLTFLAGSAVMVLALGWAFRRLQRSHRLLEERSASLSRANQELVLAAKTSAVGAVTSHLIHGLKNPLMGLQSYVANRNDEQSGDTEWLEAIASTQRMRQMISEIVRLLQDQQAGPCYEISVPELAELVAARAAPGARKARVKFVHQAIGQRVIPQREANLMALILDNLLSNAIQATPSGGEVCLKISAINDHVICEVSDQGPGLAGPAREKLFSPCLSQKEGGTGLGLAISKQLAQHLGGVLELADSSERGSRFRLTVPLRRDSSTDPAPPGGVAEEALAM